MARRSRSLFSTYRLHAITPFERQRNADPRAHTSTVRMQVDTRMTTDLAGTNGFLTPGTAIHTKSSQARNGAPVEAFGQDPPFCS